RNGFGPAKKKEKLVIPRLGNRDWRKVAEAVRAGRGMKGDGGDDGPGQGTDNAPEVGNTEERVWGLNRPGSKKAQEETSKPEAEEAEKSTEDAQDDKPPPYTENLTEDEVALRALLDPNSRQTAGAPIFIPAANEDEAFRKDHERLPSPATIESYAAIPVEEFGKAMLRGMGWVEGKDKNKNQKNEVKKRQPLLGLGAKAGGPLGDEPDFGKGKKRM